MQEIGRRSVSLKHSLDASEPPDSIPYLGESIKDTFRNGVVGVLDTHGD